MKPRYAVMAVLAVFTVLISSAAVTAADGSEAENTVSFEKYYYQQLEPNQKIIYDRMAGLAADVAVQGSAGAYYIEIAMTNSAIAYGTSDTDVLNSMLKEDACRAWEATRLDASESNNWAFWTWTIADDVAPVSVSNISVAGTGPYCVTGYTVTIGVADEFGSGFSSYVTAVNSALDSVEVGGDSVQDKVKSINSAVTGSTYRYVEDGSEHVYARTIYAIAASDGSDDRHYLTSEAFAVFFKALCDRNGVQCAQVYGLYEDSTVFAWDVVYIDGAVYAVDPANNSRSDNKESWLACGSYTSVDDNAFSKVHRAFAFGLASGLFYDFESEPLSIDGYEWHEDDGIVEVLTQYAPWILIGIICVIVAIVLVLMAKKGE